MLGRVALFRPVAPVADVVVFRLVPSPPAVDGVPVVVVVGGEEVVAGFVDVDGAVVVELDVGLVDVLTVDELPVVDVEGGGGTFVLVEGVVVVVLVVVLGIVVLVVDPVDVDATVVVLVDTEVEVVLELVLDPVDVLLEPVDVEPPVVLRQ